MNLQTNVSKSPIVSLLSWLVPLLVFFLVIRTPNDNDMWWHLSSGQYMVNHHQILTQDQFSFTKFGEKWVNAFWLADIIIYIFYRLGGFIALTIFSSGMIAAAMVIAYHRSRGPALLRAIIILIASFGLSPFNAVRPQLFSFLYLILLDTELSRARLTKKLNPILLIALFITWANLHGGYIWGLLLLIAFIIGEVLNRLVGANDASSWKFIGKLSFWSIVSALSTVINPNGPAVWKLPFYTVQISLSSINEWASPDFHRIDIQPMLWLIFIFLLGIGFSKKIVDWTDLLKFIGFVYMAFISQRSIAPFLVIAGPVVLNYFPGALEMIFNKNNKSISENVYQRQSPKFAARTFHLFNIGLILFLASISIGRVFAVTTPELINTNYPYMAVDWIKKNKPAGSMFNSYNWGGYLTWNLPDHPVFIDGRADLYGDTILHNWSQVAQGTDQGLKLLNDYNLKLVLLEPSWPILNKLPALGWQLLYKDDISVVYGR